MLSIWAISFSCIACIITWFRVEVYVTNDTFIGIIGGLIGACATIIVGTQIFNSIDTKREINNIKNSYEKKINEIETMHSDLKIELSTAKQERIRSELFVKSNLDSINALSLSEIQPFTSFLSYTKSLQYALEINDTVLILRIISNLRALTLRVGKKIRSKDQIDVAHYDKIATIDIDKFDQYHSYLLIKKEFKEIVEKMIDNIEQQKKQMA